MANDLDTPTRTISQALLVAGPLHGTIVPLPGARTVTLTPESDGEQYLYIRRGVGAGVGTGPSAETAIFVYGGRPTPAQVHDAVGRSPLSDTARMRVLDDCSGLGDAGRSGA